MSNTIVAAEAAAVVSVTADGGPGAEGPSSMTLSSDHGFAGTREALPSAAGSAFRGDAGAGDGDGDGAAAGGAACVATGTGTGDGARAPDDGRASDGARAGAGSAT